MTKDEREAQNSELRTPNSELRNQEVIPNMFVSPAVFAESRKIAGENLDFVPVMGIVNHHDAAMDLQARFFATLKKANSDINNFIILSPDHFSAGPGISYHECAYQTPEGIVEVDKSRASILEQKFIWKADSCHVFAKEHGVGALVPFIAREFPEAEIVPIFLQIDLNQTQAYALGELLAENADDKTFVLISSDMSHYLDEKTALFKDKQTLAWLSVNDFISLSAATNENTDSAGAFAVLQSFFKKKNREPRFVELDHGISTDYGGSDKETTTYITGFYRY
ncbi:MAG: AmmeMemoRadiSam system protein B [Patescibacteria group bacterium]